MKKIIIFAIIFIFNITPFAQTNMPENKRPRARETGLKIGILPTGKLNSITDVAGVSVGHKTIIRGEEYSHGRDGDFAALREIFSAKKFPARFLSATVSGN